MNHVGVRFARAALTVGEKCLLRRPASSFDVIVELRAVDRDLALIRIVDHSEQVPLIWLRRMIIR